MAAPFLRFAAVAIAPYAGANQIAVRMGPAPAIGQVPLCSGARYPLGPIGLRAFWDFAFGANVAKFCPDRGVLYSRMGQKGPILESNSLSYVTEEQRRAGQNLARAAQRVKPQEALLPLRSASPMPP